MQSPDNGAGSPVWHKHLYQQDNCTICTILIPTIVVNLKVVAVHDYSCLNTAVGYIVFPPSPGCTISLPRSSSTYKQPLASEVTAPQPSLPASCQICHWPSHVTLCMGPLQGTSSLVSWNWGLQKVRIDYTLGEQKVPLLP